MMITVAWMMMQFQMNRCRISGLEESSLFQTCITVRDVNPQLIHCLMSSSLSNLMKIKMKKVNEISLAEAELLPLEELGALVMKVGKHQGETYQEIFNDNGYLKWVAAHIPNNPKSGHDMKMFVVDMRRRLEGEIQGEDRQNSAAAKKKQTKETEKTNQEGKDQPPLIPASSSTETDIRMTEKKRILPEELPVPADDQESVSSWSRVDDVENEMAQMKGRLHQMESLLGQILMSVQKPAP